MGQYSAKALGKYDWCFGVWHNGTGNVLLLFSISHDEYTRGVQDRADLVLARQSLRELKAPRKQYPDSSLLKSTYYNLQ